MKLIYIFVFIILIFDFLSSQVDIDILEDDVNLPNETLIQETLEELIKNPINLNTAKYEELIKIPYLTPVIAYRIIETRKTKNKFNSISELSEIHGIDAELLQKIRPFVFIKQPIKPKTDGQLRMQIKLDTLSNIKRTEDYVISSRTNIVSSNTNLKLRAIILFDKDAKEKKITDFLSSCISITTDNNKLILGNYLLNFGSQLLFASPFSYINSSKNFSTGPLKAINELTGIYENTSLFGIVYSNIFSHFCVYAYLSSSLLDADIKNGTVKKIYYYTKYTDSLSQARRDQLRENLIGTRLTYIFNQSCRLGTTIYYNNYNKPFAPIDSNNSFYGQSLYLCGVDMQTNFNNYFLKSEIAYSITHGLGFANQIIGDWQFIKVNLNLYAQQKSFFSPHSKWRELTNRKDRLTSSFNIFYNLSGFKMYLLASSRQDFVIDSLPARVQYRLERKQGRVNFQVSLKGNYKEAILNTYGTRFDMAYSVTKKLILYTRIEDRYSKELPKSGRLVSLGTKFKNDYLGVESRFYYFNITSPDCKIYCYEPIKNSFVFNNEGIRLFCNLDSKIENVLKINYYFGYTKSDIKNIDTGLQVALDL